MYTKSKKFVSLLFVIVILISGILAGCTPSSSAPVQPTDANEEPANQTQEPSEAPAAENSETEARTLVIGTNADIQTVDPQALNSGATTAVLHNIYSKLLKQDDQGTLVPDLATEYSLKDDTTWSFTIRDDAYFHNGDKVTANDVKYSIERVHNDETSVEYTHFKQIAGVNVIDDTHLEIMTAAPLPTLPNLIAKSGGEILPQKYIEENGMDYFLQHPVGSGPYKMTSYVKDERVVLVPNENYYDTVNPDWSEVIFRVIPESSTRVGELIAGNVDVINNVIPAEWDRVNNNNGDTSVQFGPSTRVYQLALKVNEPFPTSDIRVRQAIDYAIDDQLIVDQILKGAGTVTLTRVPGGVTGQDVSLYGKYNYDPAKAKELLTEAGYPDGFKLKIQAPTGRYLMDTEIAQVIAAMLGEVGIDVQLEMLESSAYSNIFSAMSSEDAFLTCFGLGFFDASYAMIGYTEGYTMGETNYDDKYFNELYTKAQTNMNEEERLEQFYETQQIIARDIPYVVMMQIQNSFGVKSNISFTPRLDDVWNIQTIHSK
jgi:peptide/nickel transport system substrate-binding protein